MGSRAIIEHVSKRTWRIYILHGFTLQYGGMDGYGWHRHTREGAERKAIRELARYRRKFEDIELDKKVVLS